MTSTIILVFSLLAQLGPGDVVSPIGPSSGNTTSGGPGGLDRSSANLGDSQGPFTGSTPPMSTGSETSGSVGTTGTSTSTGTGSGTSTGTSTDIPITGASGSGYGGGTNSTGSSTGLGTSTTGGMR